MKLGIIGLPQAGKTTVFNALTRGDKPTGPGRVIGGGRFEVQTAVVYVPDVRVDKLSAMFKPRKTIYTQVQYADIAGLEANEEAAKSGFSGALLNQLTGMDGYLLVIRAFEDPAIPHPSGSVNPKRDLETIDGEMLINDLISVEKKLEKLKEDGRKGIIKDKGAHQQEMDLFTKLHAALSADTPIRDVELTVADEKALASFGLLTRKPMLIVYNIGDEKKDVSAFPAYTHQHSASLTLQGKLEMEIAQLPADDAQMFMQEYGIEELSLNKVIRISYDLLGLQSFFTVGEDEVRAWTVQRGATAPEAAGEIHSDLQKGFIRAEVSAYEELIAAGGYAELKTKGRLRLEGKEYLVQDGDILNIRFSPPGK